MSWREDMGNFDLSRLTVIGWLAFILSIVAAIAASCAVGFSCIALFPAKERNLALKIGGLAGAISAVGFFFAFKALLGAMGVLIVRPKDGEPTTSDSAEFARLQRRLDQAKQWRLFFLILMPLALLLTGGIALGLAYASGPAGFNHFYVLGVGALVLPILFAGCLLMHSDVGRHAQVLAAARQGSARHGNASDGSETAYK